MLNHDNRYFKLHCAILYLLLLFLFSFCSIQTDSNEKTNSIKKFDSVIYKASNDSISLWCKNKLGLYTSDGINFSYALDSNLCFNNKKDRFITAFHSYTLLSDASSDGLIYFFGEKINKIWYFFRGASIVIPREMVKGHPINQPLSYQQLHEIALKEVYAGYLNDKGEINENWFKYHFDDAMMSYRKYATKEEYNKLLIAQCKGIWAERYRPYKPEDFNFVYDKKSKLVNFSFDVQTFDSIYNYPRLFKVIYEYPGLGYLEGACGPYWCDEMDWFKNKTAKVQLKNIPENTEVKIYLEFIYFPDVRSERMGPFIFNTTSTRSITII